MIKIITGLLLVVMLTTVAATTVFAHEDSEEGGYRIVVGFLHEPAYEGEMNAVSIRVTKFATEEEKTSGHGDSMEMEVDVNEHGAIFLSPMIPAGESFEFQMPDKFAGMAIPFHNHLDHEVTGVITVEDIGQGDGMAERVTVSIGDAAFEPAEVSVNPDSTIVFVNNTRAAQNVTSGVMDDGGMMDMIMESTGDHEGANTVPVEGLQDTLSVEVTHVASETSRTMTLRAVYGEPGHYVADLIPTSPGHYRFRFFGRIEENPVDKAFDSKAGGGGFDDVQTASVIHFPETVASAREIEGAVRGAQTTAQDAREEALNAGSGVFSAIALGIIGIVVGAIGIALGGVALLVSSRRGN